MGMLVHLVELGDGVWLSPADTSAHDKHLMVVNVCWSNQQRSIDEIVWTDRHHFMFESSSLQHKIENN